MKSTDFLKREIRNEHDPEEGKSNECLCPLRDFCIFYIRASGFIFRPESFIRKSSAERNIRILPPDYIEQANDSENQDY